MSESMIMKLRELNPDISFHKSYLSKPLTDVQKAYNTLISKVRSSVEHVFGIILRSMCGLFFNCIGKDRAFRDIGLKNIGYHIKRLCTLKRQTA